MSYILDETTQRSIFSFQWSHLEQNNFTIEEYIANKKAELNFEPVKNKVMKIQAQYNNLLIECLKNKSSI